MRDQEKVAKPPQLAQTGWCGQGLFDHTTRPLLQRRLRCFFLMSRPPLLLLRRGAPWNPYPVLVCAQTSFAIWTRVRRETGEILIAARARCARRGVPTDL